MPHSVLLFMTMHSIYCCHAIVFDQIQFLDLSSVSPFRTFSRVNLLRCIYECKTRLRCDVIKYSATRKECYLIIDSSVDTGERRPGIVSGRKSDWDMFFYLPCAVCGLTEACDFSANGSVTCQIDDTVPGTTYVGNIYSVGARVCYSCESSYINIGGDINCSICAKTGIWTQVNIQCITTESSPDLSTEITTTTKPSTTTTTFYSVISSTTRSTSKTTQLLTTSNLLATDTASDLSTGMTTAPALSTTINTLTTVSTTIPSTSKATTLLATSTSFTIASSTASATSSVSTTTPSLTWTTTTHRVIYGTLFYNPDKTKTLAQAKNLCEKGSRGSLAKIDDATDYQRVINFLKQQSDNSVPKPVWIGLYYDQTSKQFRWMSDNSEATYFNWKPGSPESLPPGGDKMYVKLELSNFQYESAPGSDEYGFICEQVR